MLIAFSGMETRRNFIADVWFSGRVQGVGFRWHTLKIAREFDVAGTVRNLADGRVHLRAEGAEREVQAFVAAVEEEMKPFIRETEKKTGEGAGRSRGFSIVG